MNPGFKGQDPDRRKNPDPSKCGSETLVFLHVFYIYFQIVVHRLYQVVLPGPASLHSLRYPQVRWNTVAAQERKRGLLTSVVEPFHFGPAPAPASQNSGSGFRSSSSSSPVVHNLLLKTSLYKFNFSIYRGLFYSQKGMNVLLCSSSTLLKGTD